ncbi:hypothetical protein GALMADRAFT_257629 [Galerina marginata CBS 339.88]|uniref:Asl1-like glycosyl hydrolase catalytic domain-containing protein n=1 Tax=Galerina marginata (strain CBS 339.88) TaxID=685588 RepID=A0A067SA64_GALM3|nr:hypothetical protein GALMADRAFT_257629 [Galerina marginata CBS 339.88]
MRNIIFCLGAILNVAAVVSAQAGKVGLAWSLGNDPSLKNFVTSKVSAIHTWSPSKPAGSDSLGLEFVPMLWGTTQISDFVNLVKPGYAKSAMGFNEPDQVAQSNLDPNLAAAYWNQYLQPLKAQGYNLLSPAVSSSPSGKVWLQKFLNACSGCSIDAIALHWYGSDPQAFISYVEGFHSSFGKNLWVTEFGYQDFSGAAPNQEQVTNFIDIVTAWMDSTTYVSKYFAIGLNPQGTGPTQLMNSSKQPTALGLDYLT